MDAHLRPSNSNLGLPVFIEAAAAGPEISLSMGAEPAVTAPDLSALFFVFISSVTFFNPAK